MTTTERIQRLERATAQAAYLLHGPRGLRMLRAQAPDLAELLSDWLDGTQPVNDSHFAGRETTEHIPSNEQRTAA